MPVLDVKTGRVNALGLQESHLDECKRLVRSGEGWARCIIGGHEVVRAAMPNREYERLASQLRVGDTIYRNLRDGDVVVLNRQPTLHRNGFTVRLIKMQLTPRLTWCAWCPTSPSTCRRTSRSSSTPTLTATR